MVNLLCATVVGIVWGLALFPESIGKTLAQVHKGYRKEMER